MATVQALNHRQTSHLQREKLAEVAITQYMQGKISEAQHKNCAHSGQKESTPL
jgi:hypothetical protein